MLLIFWLRKNRLLSSFHPIFFSLFLSFALMSLLPGSNIYDFSLCSVFFLFVPWTNEVKRGKWNKKCKKGSKRCEKERTEEDPKMTSFHHLSNSSSLFPQKVSSFFHFSQQLSPSTIFDLFSSQREAVGKKDKKFLSSVSQYVLIHFFLLRNGLELESSKTFLKMTVGRQKMLLPIYSVH